MKQNLEAAIDGFVTNPNLYFRMVTGSKDRYRNYLERNFERQEVGKLLRHPGGDTFDYFVRKDYKKHARNG